MKSFEIKQNDAAQRLDRFLSKAVPLLPQPLMYKFIRTKKIKLNGKRAEISSRLNAGDVVDLYIADEFFAERECRYDFMRASSKLEVVYEDENIILLDKPAGLLSHPDEGEYTDTLITRVQRYLYERGEYDPAKEDSFTPSLANRIDRNTSGIVIAAKNAEALRVLNQKIKDRELVKLYLCIAHGEMKKKSDTLTGYLFKDEVKNRVYVYNDKKPGSREIKTRYTVLRKNKDLSLLEIDLLTGRTHQIRAHLASIGHPLLGDGKYGMNEQNKKWGQKKQCLCSYKLRFEFTSPSGILEYLNGREFEVKNVWFMEIF